MRTTLLPGVLKAAATNIGRRLPSARLYEVGKVFLSGGSKLPEQPDRLAFVIAGTPESDWLSPGEEPDVYDGTGVVELLADRLGVPDIRLRQATVPTFHPGRSAEVLAGDAVLGAVGEVHPDVVEAFGLSGRVVAAEIDLGELLVDRGHWQYEQPSVYPPIIFDMAFLLDEGVPAARVLEAAEEGAGEDLEHLKVFDVFRGESIGEGKKSIAVTFRLRAGDRTLTDDEVAPVRRSIAAEVASATGGEVRGEV